MLLRFGAVPESNTMGAELMQHFRMRFQEQIQRTNTYGTVLQDAQNQAMQAHERMREIAAQERNRLQALRAAADGSLAATATAAGSAGVANGTTGTTGGTNTPGADTNDGDGGTTAVNVGGGLVANIGVGIGVGGGENGEVSAQGGEDV